MMVETIRGDQMENVPRLMCCPNCQSEYIIFIHLPELVKLSKNRKRYVCTNCKSGFYVDPRKHGADSANDTIEEHQRHFDFFRAR